MPKVGMEPIRQQQYIEATLETIHDEGLHATTLSKVARRAGTSTGLVAHYFRDKSGLLEATFRHLARELGREYRRQLVRAQTPLERALALIEANFAESQARPAIVSGWLSFWSQVNHRPELARVQRVVASRLRSNLLHDLRHLLPLEDAVHVATGLPVLIDGLWLRATLTTGGVSFPEARELARDYLMTQLAVREKEAPHDRTA
ncbi:choline-binding transcriptional repressor BetI [Arhodomonas sp. AD133]|uniref:choline-binding transcriptional repressor BetI n=1 Tax=Arhodomonas sp. AD133 TaxID=3415009 RepID=UPI003EC12BF8